MRPELSFADLVPCHSRSPFWEALCPRCVKAAEEFHCTALALLWSCLWALGFTCVWVWGEFFLSCLPLGGSNDQLWKVFPTCVTRKLGA